MSRRWYRHGAQVVFFGWEPSERGFYLNVVDLCATCHGTGEIGATEEVCPGCGGEGIQPSAMHPSSRHGGFSLDALVAEFDRRGLPLPETARRDLRADQAANAGSLLHEYDEV